jgi:hypothetical protein
MEWRGEQPQFNGDYALTFHVFFDSAAPAQLQGVSAIDGLRAFADHAQTCLDGFKVRCSELGY